MGLTLSQVTVDHIEAYYELKSKTGRLDGRPGGLSKRTLKLHHTVLNMIFKEGMRRRLIQSNPCSVAELPIRSDKSFKGQFLTEQQCKDLLAAMEGKPIHDMVQVTLIYGLRRSELMGLKWDAVDLERGTLAIRHTAVVNKEVQEKDKTKNSSSNRIYPILPVVREILLHEKEKQETYRKIFRGAYQESGYVFTHEDGSAYYPSYPSHELQKTFENHPELQRVRYHDLRHPCASLLFDRGWSMKDVSEWLGHSGVAITMDTYTHIYAHRKAMLSKELEDLFQKVG